jgi:hypothetical protein
MTAPNNILKGRLGNEVAFTIVCMHRDQLENRGTDNLRVQLAQRGKSGEAVKVRKAQTLGTTDNTRR